MSEASVLYFPHLQIRNIVFYFSTKITYYWKILKYMHVLMSYYTLDSYNFLSLPEFTYDL